MIAYGHDYISKLTLSEESSRTRKLFGLLSFIASSHVVGTTLVLDELELLFYMEWADVFLLIRLFGRSMSKRYFIVMEKGQVGKKVVAP